MKKSDCLYMMTIFLSVIGVCCVILTAYIIFIYPQNANSELAQNSSISQQNNSTPGVTNEYTVSIIATDAMTSSVENTSSLEDSITTPDAVSTTPVVTSDASISNSTISDFSNTTENTESVSYTTPVSDTISNSTTDDSELTMGQKNALKSAQDYLAYTSFSYTGLIRQLEFEKYSHEDAVYAADHCNANWNEQATLSAKSYLDYTSFSRDGLISQLEFDGFTTDQAIYGVEQNGY